MIESICIQRVASFGHDPENLKDLLQHNFIFGVNGTGKTTISRIIANESAFPHCRVTWRGGTKLETLVYNRDFVDKNFGQASELKGIFTLGEEDKDAVAKITTAKEELDKLVDSIQTLKQTLQGKDGEGGKESELRNLETEFREKCWELKQKHDDKLQGAFTGFRSDKRLFKNELLKQAQSKPAELLPLSELHRKAPTVFGKGRKRAEAIPVLEHEDLLGLESDPILKKKIIGKTDVDIAAMIQKLGNSDWVKQGREFYEVNDKSCPFCQQDTEDSFAASLDEYFDETFETDTNRIRQLYEDYRVSSERVAQSLRKILASSPEFLDVDKLKSQEELIEAKFRTNLQRIQAKCDKPSTSVDLESLSKLLTASKDVIEAANTAITDHNEMVDNRDREKRILRGQVWKYLLESEIKSDLATYEKKKKDLSNAISSLTAQVDTKETASKVKKAEIRDLERTTTSIEPTIDNVNALLRLFGFTGFTLAKSDTERFYKIVRLDGTDAKETLSEGERNFITFLYFYYLLKGSKSETGMTTDRVVVFDDPVSSLDSDVLFIVSALIRELLEEARKGTGHIKQIFVLTHNVYFHKEVSFNNKRRKGVLKEKSFWIVRKARDASVLERYNTNPIKTSYELLWLEVRNRNRSSLAIQNTLRRILETYFKHLGYVDPDRVYSRFEGKDKLICKSLFSWLHAGSHFAYDDLYISADGPSVDAFLTVFQRVFEKTGHVAHYKMMMGEDSLEDAP